MLRDLFSLFPAYAGVILGTKIIPYVKDPFPRIRGGDPPAINSITDATVFSPHTRG